MHSVLGAAQEAAASTTMLRQPGILRCSGVMAQPRRVGASTASQLGRPPLALEPWIAAALPDASTSARSLCAMTPTTVAPLERHQQVTCDPQQQPPMETAAVQLPRRWTLRLTRGLPSMPEAWKSATHLSMPRRLAAVQGKARPELTPWLVPSQLLELHLPQHPGL